MFVLSINSLQSPNTLRVPLNLSEQILLGRSSKAALPIPWDPAISREHATIMLVDDKLQLQCLPTARNPAVFNEQPAYHFMVEVGQEFRIGSTNFRLEEEASPEPPPVERPAFATQEIDVGGRLVNFDAIDDSKNEALLEQHSFDSDELSNFSFGKADERIEMLSKLPKLIADSNSDEELALSLASLLLKAIPKATAVAVAQFPVDELPEDDDQEAEFPKPIMLRIDTHDSFNGTFRPSRRLISKALKDKQSLLQIWHGSAGSANFTMSDGLGWAIVTPILGQSCEGWCLYVSGAGSEGTVIVTQKSLTSDLRCAELIAQFIGSVRQVRLLEGQKTRMSSFFSPKIVESLTGLGPEGALTPTERDVAVLFCDVRNFSQKSEELHEDLVSLLKSVSTALGTMTDGILDFDGTIADFQGDAALGFWGWPVENPSGPIPACLAALKILETFESADSEKSPLLNGFSIGMGISYGPALAGEIGTERQSKLGVFGPVVNAGSRLQGLSKKFGVSICVDQLTATYARKHLPKEMAHVRRLGNVVPRGMVTPINIYSIEPVNTKTQPLIDASVYDSFDMALDSVQSGDWSTASMMLKDLPPEDGPTQFLKGFLQENEMNPPEGWVGTIHFNTK